MTFGLVHANYSLPKWQAVKLTFFAPCFLVTALVYSSTFLTRILPGPVLSSGVNLTTSIFTCSILKLFRQPICFYRQAS